MFNSWRSISCRSTFKSWSWSYKVEQKYESEKSDSHKFECLTYVVLNLTSYVLLRSTMVKQNPWWNLFGITIFVFHLRYSKVLKFRLCKKIKSKITCFDRLSNVFSQFFYNPQLAKIVKTIWIGRSTQFQTYV